jgi:hypothetical protein
MISTPISLAIVVLFFLIFSLVTFFSWFDYKRIPPFLGKMFPKGPINHQKWAASKPGEWYLKLFSLCGLLLMGWVVFRVINPSFNPSKASSIAATPQPKIVAKQSKENLVLKPISGKLVTSYDPSSDSATELISDSGEIIKIPDNIKSQLGGDIRAYAIPVHPQNPDIVFLSTAEFGNDFKVINRIFAYNIKTYDLTQIYQEEVQHFNLRTAGREGSKILLIREDANSSPPSCSSLWLHYKSRTFEYLELADIQGGLKPYTVPEYRIKQDEIEDKKCAKKYLNY